MQCINCSTDIEDGKLYCPNCGKEVQIVPDYNPLDEILTAQVKGAISGQRMQRPRYHSTNDNVKKQKDLAYEKARRRKQHEKKLELKKKKRRKFILFIISFFIFLGFLCFFIYSTSYTGKINKAYKELHEQQYEMSIKSFKSAIRKKEKKPEAYTGLAKVYQKQGEDEKAEALFLETIDAQSSNDAIYKAAIQYYIDTDQAYKVSILLDNCENKTVLTTLKAYQSPKVSFSLEEENFEDVQQLSLSSKGEVIYYTIDDTAPTTQSIKYVEPIQLGEGTTIIRAISVNKKEIPSLEQKKEYVIELPSEDAPAVTPSTGQYEQDINIEIQVPEGCSAYYTMDGTTPTKSSRKYTGPVSMPKGNTIFSAILVNSNDKMSSVTKRNYDLAMD